MRARTSSGRCARRTPWSRASLAPTPWRSGCSPRIDDLEAGLAKIADEVDIFHTQDCISARAAARVRDAGASVQVVRTVHHVDDFTTQALIDCQRKAIEEPDHADRGQPGLAQAVEDRLRR